MKSHIFIDTEYCLTCAMREDLVPNYNNLVNMWNERYENPTYYAYFVGDERKKRGISNFLFKIGIQFRTIFDVEHYSKPQIVGAQIAIDTMKLLQTSEQDQFVYMTGDDYMVPIAEYVCKYNSMPHIYYFPVILSRGVTESKMMKLFRLGPSYLTERKSIAKNDESRNTEVQK